MTHLGSRAAYKPLKIWLAAGPAPPARYPKHLNRRRMRQDVFVSAAAGDLAQKIDPSQIGDEGKIRARAQGIEIQAKGQAGRSAPQIRIVWRQRIGKRSQVLVRPAVGYIQILSCARTQERQPPCRPPR